ncbi:hypothetical protein CYPRO_0441 [Cyclonatronum proteinivorum]|uniref:Uncharacterized protein n=1 Tax=Cyclonatronum proteinivorum TaxID=1457365 RepID=A0A345UGX6_9BACT|nr:hypothetical protein [Cyclonatronum proteinivorum]AXI99727.1 hypothetical protein CYPRO_0441 [Cyclonatronum proteinivorum]
MSASASFRILFFLMVFMVLGACRSTLDLGEGTIFRFEFEGEQYEIIGYNQVEGRDEGVNDLVLREGRTVRLWARDNTQDGFIDRIFEGDVTLSEANRIYLAGIHTAMDRGNYRERPFERRFELLDGFLAFDIISLLVDEEGTYNLFVIRDIKTREVVSIRDFGRDGILDDPLITEEDRAFWQTYYTRTLETGKALGRVRFINEAWIVALPDQL